MGEVDKENEKEAAATIRDTGRWHSDGLNRLCRLLERKVSKEYSDEMQLVESSSGR